jgi:hypothetical protein
MKLIAHRGLVNGPNKERENHPDQIKEALRNGYDCEIDIRWIDNAWYLGHDNPDHSVPYEFLEQPGLWIHAKNLDALYVLGADAKLNFFWHQEDDHTLTSQGYIWTYPRKTLTKNSVMVMPEWNDTTLANAREADCYAVCSDFVELLK